MCRSLSSSASKPSNYPSYYKLTGQKKAIQPRSDGLHPTSYGLQPKSDGLWFLLYGVVTSKMSKACLKVAMAIVSKASCTRPLETLQKKHKNI